MYVMEGEARSKQWTWDSLLEVFHIRNYVDKLFFGNVLIDSSKERFSPLLGCFKWMFELTWKVMNFVHLLVEVFDSHSYLFEIGNFEKGSYKEHYTNIQKVSADSFLQSGGSSLDAYLT